MRMGAPRAVVSAISRLPLRDHLPSPNAVSIISAERLTTSSATRWVCAVARVFAVCGTLLQRSKACMQRTMGVVQGPHLRSHSTHPRAWQSIVKAREGIVESPDLTCASGNYLVLSFQVGERSQPEVLGCVCSTYRVTGSWDRRRS